MDKRRITSLALMISLIVSIIGFTPAPAFAAYQSEIGGFTYGDYVIPAYDGDMYEMVNDNDPNFVAAEKTTTAFETYSELDALGRCGVAYANVGRELMPTEDRESIGMVKPTGWMQAKYDFVDGKYLYNRCHLIGYQLTGENANERNLITGTRAFNVDGMLDFENLVARYVQMTGNHVLYRVTPVFQGDNLLATGVLIEAESVEDNTIAFCVFCYNVQDKISIDYGDGSSCLTSDLIVQPKIKDCKISLSKTSYVYDGKAKNPTVTIKDGTKKLTKGVDYTLAYSNNVKAGTGLIKITGKGRYTGTTTRSFKITTKSIKGCTISVVANKVYTGKQIKPIVTVKNGAKKLVKGTHYTVTYGKNVNTGKGVLTVKGKGNYTGSQQVFFNIVPKKTALTVSSKEKTTIKVKWTDVKGESGYQLAYKNKGANQYTYKVVSGKSATVKNLKAGTTYQIKIRAYKVIDNQKVYGAWSKMQTAKTTGGGIGSVAGSGDVTDGGTIVYITETGTKYHLSEGCRGLSNANGIIQVPLSEAKAKGLTLCGYED